jgi:hypothetical protein
VWIVYLVYELGHYRSLGFGYDVGCFVSDDRGLWGCFVSDCNSPADRRES